MEYDFGDICRLKDCGHAMAMDFKYFLKILPNNYVSFLRRHKICFTRFHLQAGYERYNPDIVQRVYEYYYNIPLKVIGAFTLCLGDIFYLVIDSHYAYLIFESGLEPWDDTMKKKIERRNQKNHHILSEPINLDYV